MTTLSDCAGGISGVCVGVGERCNRMVFVPTQEELEAFLDSRPNQGRWGDDDEVGAVNLVTTDKVREAAALVQTGQRLSLSRPVPVTPSRNNPRPAQHYMMQWIREIDNRAGSATDYYGMAYHGQSYTHLDALCHQWDKNGMWGGRNPREHVGFDGVSWAGVQNWRDGIVTRGVLLDVPAHRNRPYVTADDPVHGDELHDIAAKQGVSLRPGDLVAVHCGRDAYDRGERLPWGTKDGHPTGQDPRPGLHASCLWFLRDADCAILAWDMLDHRPSGYTLPFTVHAALFTMGIGLVDNALLGPLAEHCHRVGRYEFMIVVAPLLMEGGTGSPVNPVAIF
jgi:kynurenine formamidase